MSKPDIELRDYVRYIRNAKDTDGAVRLMEAFVNRRIAAKDAELEKLSSKHQAELAEAVARARVEAFKDARKMTTGCTPAEYDARLVAEISRLTQPPQPSGQEGGGR